MNFLKHFPSPTREWKNNFYFFNENNLYKTLAASETGIKIIKSYFYAYNKDLENKIRRKNLALRLKRLSLHKIFVTEGEFKHTNNKSTITLYMLNRQRLGYNLNIKKEYLKVFKHSNKKLYPKLNALLNKLIYLITKLKNNKEYLLINNDIKNINYVSLYLSKYLKQRLIKFKKYIYLKQLIYINHNKQNYIYLRVLKKNLERVFNKNIEFNIIYINQFFLNSDIAMDTITTKITKNRRKLLINLKQFNEKIKPKNKLFYMLNIRNNRLNNLRFSLFNLLKHKYIYGYRFEARGRLTKRYTASRSRYVFEHKGNLANVDSSFKGISSVLLKNNLKSNLQYTKLKSKTRIGSFGIKGWISSN